MQPVTRTVRLAGVHRYQRLHALASGGMGTVYLGRMISADSVQTVAIKVLHPHLANDSDMVSMFLDEARVATRLRHPNLVGVLDMDMLNDELIIVMEYVEGTTLGTMQSTLRKRGERLPVGIAVRIMCDALAGLHVVHELLDEKGHALGLVHRDVSPHNLMVGSDGVTRVTDFGIALTAGRLATTRPDGTVKGKLQYLAPEQVGRKPVDRRVDVFAAGIVLWECLTGERLFDAPTEAETVTRVLRDPVTPPSMLRPEISTELDEVSLQALERDPDRRFKTAQEFADALRRAFAPVPDAGEVGLLVRDLASEAIRTQRHSIDRAALLSRSAPSGKKKRTAIAFAITCLIVGGAAVPVVLHLRQPAPSTKPPSALLEEHSARSTDAPPTTTAPLAVPKASAEPEVANPPPAARGRSTLARTAVAPAPEKPTPKPPRPFMPDDL